MGNGRARSEWSRLAGLAEMIRSCVLQGKDPYELVPAQFRPPPPPPRPISEERKKRETQLGLQVFRQVLFTMGR